MCLSWCKFPEFSETPPAFKILMFLNEVMQETRKICTSETGPIWATPENLPFLKMKIIIFFLIPMYQKYQNESAPIFCYAKSTKNCLKLLRIADLQPLDWIQRKKKHPVDMKHWSRLCNFVYSYNVLTATWLPEL